MLKTNTSDSFPGADYVAGDPISTQECCLFASIEALGDALAAEGTPYTFRGGRLFFNGTAADLEDVCDGVEPTVASVVPDPLVDKDLNSVNGTGFGTADGEVWLTDTANYDTAPTKVEQAVVIWGDVEVQFTGVMGGLAADPVPAWIWVFNGCGRRNSVGFETSIEPGV